MKKIRVIAGGCGIEYKDDHGNTRFALKTAENDPFECEDALAARFVDAKVAVYVETETAAEANVAGQNGEQEEEEDEVTQKTEKPSAHFVAEDLEEWDYNDLKKLAADMGVTPAGKKKADYITAIVAADLEIDEEEEDDLPELGVADPE